MRPAAHITWWMSPRLLCKFCTASDKRAGPGNEAIKLQCIFHSVGCDSAALLHKSHGQCDFPWMQALWHVNIPVVLSGDFFVYLLFVMHVSSSQCSMSTHPPRPSPLCCFLILFTTILSIHFPQLPLPQLPLILFTSPFHIFLIVSYLALSVVHLITYQ